MYVTWTNAIQGNSDKGHEHILQYTVYSKMNHTCVINIFAFHDGMISIFVTFWLRCCFWVLRWLIGFERQLSTSIIVHPATGQPTDAKKPFLPMRCWTCCKALAMLQIRTWPQTWKVDRMRKGSARDDDCGKHAYNIDYDNNIATVLMNEWDVKGHLEQWAV